MLGKPLWICGFVSSSFWVRGVRSFEAASLFPTLFYQKSLFPSQQASSISHLPSVSMFGSSGISYAWVDIWKLAKSIFNEEYSTRFIHVAKSMAVLHFI